MVILSPRCARPPEPAPAGAAAAVPARVFHHVDTGVPATPVPNAGLRIDLYVPELPPGAKPPPLLVWAVGGTWAMPDKNYVVAAALGDAMQRLGVATAVVRFALAGDYRLPACIQDAARSIAALARAAGRYGYGPGRVVLGGNDTGALLMADVALSGALARAGLPGAPAGVVALRAVFDLAPAILKGHPQQGFLEWAAGSDRGAVSPIAQVRADAPPFLILSGGGDYPGYAQRARSFVRALERAGAPDSLAVVVPERDGDSLLNLSGEGNPLGPFVAGFVRGQPMPEPVESPFGVKERWSTRPPMSSEPFWTGATAPRQYKIDGRFRWMLQRIFEKQMYELNPWPGETYDAIDLLDYLRARPPVDAGEGDYLVVTNMRDERLYFTRRDLERYRPRLVVGMDDERNLYRVFAAYRMERTYSWLDRHALTPTMIRPVGAFLHFPGELPQRLWNGSFAAFGLSPGSFRWQRADPLAPIRDLSPRLQAVLSGASGCLTCHALRGAGARSHHITAERAEPAGAYALALEEYPPQVLHDFLFEQDRVSTLFGVKPLPVKPAEAADLVALVERERQQHPRATVLGPLPDPPGAAMTRR
jgi:acetyl esterase/lipase